MDRRTLQRAIHAGRLHLDAQHCLSTDELLLAGYLIADAPQAPPLSPPQETPLLPLLTRLALAIERLVDEVRQLRTDLRQAPRPAPQEGPREPTQDAPQTTRSPPPGVYDPAAAFARMQILKAEGLTLAQIAAQLTAEGVPTRQGRPWHKSTVNYLLKTRGR
jgi:hypothetical protein